MNNTYPNGEPSNISDGWHHTLVSSMALCADQFQLVYPALVITKNDEWLSMLDILPPETRHWYQEDRIYSSFYGLYQEVIKTLPFPETAFQDLIGTSAFLHWNSYLLQQESRLPKTELPVVWMNWALIYAPDVANIGRSYLCKQIFAPQTQQNSLTDVDETARLPLYFPFLTDINQILKDSPATHFYYNSPAGNNEDIKLLWNRSAQRLNEHMVNHDAPEDINQKFAISNIKIKVRFDHFSIIPVTPGTWFDADLLDSLRHYNPSDQQKNIYEKLCRSFFGKNSTLNHIVSSVIFADGINLHLESDAPFTTSEQKIITSQNETGYWPLYLKADHRCCFNKVDFKSGRLHITTSTSAHHPVRIGQQVQYFDKYPCF